jgi:GDP/UDP-N,N'-diacetylbacillosamine 2-epimerase (hydrolysing)
MKIVVLTGTRAEYGLFESLLNKLNTDGIFDLSLLVTGMHLSPEFGLTIDLIKRDGYKIGAIVPMNISGDTKDIVAQSTGLGVINHTSALSLLEPDLLIVLGDRIEPLSAALSATILGIPIAHISGGDLTRGSIDDTYRNLLSKMAQIHFVSTQTSHDRLLSLGEDSKSIYNVGSLSIDMLSTYTDRLSDVFFKIFNTVYDESCTYAIVLYHPETISDISGGRVIDVVISTIVDQYDFILVIKPNSDSGYAEIISKIDLLLNRYNNVKTVHNLARNDYLSILSHADLLIGNSSSGIVECSYLKVPVINIGDRQSGRDRANNVIDISNEKLLEDSQIIKNILNNNILSEKFINLMKESSELYGNGMSAEKIVNILKSRLPIRTLIKSDPLSLKKS